MYSDREELRFRLFELGVVVIMYTCMGDDLDVEKGKTGEGMRLCGGRGLEVGCKNSMCVWNRTVKKENK